MAKKAKSIPVEPLAEEFHAGIAISKIATGDIHSFEEAHHSHRHDYHFFLLQEKGSCYLEIDFEKYTVAPSSILYIHPDQVHRMLEAAQAGAYIVAINSESLHTEYLKLLEELMPAQPLVVESDQFAVLKDAIALCMRIFDSKQNRLYASLLKDSCNTLVALMVSLYLEQEKPADKLSRFDLITRGFKLKLERDFASAKRPADYARSLNISTSYLNECVKNATGFPVSYHIQQRNILEAKRLLYHSNKSVKEIAAVLGYPDYAYFSRLFAKATGFTAMAFRRKNLG